MLSRTRGLVIVFISLTLVVAATSVAPAYQDIVATYSEYTDFGNNQPATTFGDGKTVYVTVSDSGTTGTPSKPITVTNDVEGNSITVLVTEGATTYVYEGSFVIHSGEDEANKLHMTDGQKATIKANLDGDIYYDEKKITADYDVVTLKDQIWTYSDSSRTVEETEFGDGDPVYVKVTDTETKGGTKVITVENTNIGNTISVNVTDLSNNSFYIGYFIVYSGANDDASDKLALFYGESATITADLDGDGAPGTATITADYTAPAPTNLTATAIAGGSIRVDWTPSSPETNVDQYKIYRSTTSEGQDFNSPLASVSAGTGTYTDSATASGVTYYYAVRAQDKSGNMEDNTNEAMATADAILPPSPTNLQAVPISGDGIELTWTASSPETDVFRYNIYRATSSAQDYSSPTYTVSVGTTSYRDDAATPGVTYYYVVRAQDTVGNTDNNTNEVWATAGFSFTVSEVYIRHQGTALYDLSSSTSRNNPTVFASGAIDEIYLKVTIYTIVPLNESSSTIALYKLVDSETETVSGNQEIGQDTGTAELSFDLDPVFDPAVDNGTRDGTYWLDITVVDTGGNSEDFNFYFIYDTLPPSAPDFQITSYNPSSGSITVSGTTAPDNLSDPQDIEVFVNYYSKGTVTADASYQFAMSGIALDAGRNYVTVRSKDKAGNESELSEGVEFDSNPAALLSVVFRTSHVVQSGSPIEIIYSVTEDAAITIGIYNLVGEVVKDWAGNASSGTENKWTWYGRNMYEEDVNNGTYIFKISAETSGGSHDHKINLLGVAR